MNATTHPDGHGRTARQVRGFLALVILLSGGPWAAALLLGGDISRPVVLALYALGACGPTLAALVLRLRGVRSPRVGRWDRWQRWAPVALAAGVVPAAVTAWVAPVLGAPPADLTAVPGMLAEQGGLLVFLAVHTVTGPLSEELGWRGFLQPRLRRRLSPLGTSVLLGTVWALWHLPFFAMEGTWQSTLGLAQALLYLVCMVPMSMAYWFVSERLRGGVPGAVLLHYVGNVSLSLLALTSTASFVVYVVTWLVLAALVGVLARGARTGEAARPTLVRAG